MIDPDLPLVRAVALTRRFGDVTAVDGIDFAVRPGELFGFLGPNGAGKTTTMRLLTGLLVPTSGEAFVAGHSLTANPQAARAALGFVPDTPFLYEKLTAREFLAFNAALHGVPRDRADRRARALFTLLELEPAADGLIEGYSHGMRQKTALAGALVHDPQVLFLDEPTIGLDPRSARTIKDLLRGLCDRVGILSRGRLAVLGTIAELKEQARTQASLEEIFLGLTGGNEGADLSAFLDESVGSRKLGTPQ